MATPANDLSTTANQQPTTIYGSTAAGVAETPVGSSATGDLFVRDAIESGLTSGAKSVGTTAVLAAVSTTNFANRKVIQITPTNGTIYWGATNAVTVATGTPIYQGQQFVLSIPASVSFYLVAAATTDVRIVEGA